MKILRRYVRTLLTELSVFDYKSQPPNEGEKITVLKTTLDLNRLDSVEQPDGDFTPKPHGLFYGCGDEWIRYVKDPDNQMAEFKRGRAFLYRLELKYTTIDKPNPVAVCKIDSDKAFKDFSEMYVSDDQMSRTSIASPDWERFANDFGGVEFCPLPAGPMWLRGYDVDQGCVWNKSAVVSNKMLYHDPSNEIKPKPTSIGQAFEMYPEIYELLSDSHDIDERGYVPGHDAMWKDMSVQQFIDDEYEDPSDSGFWRSGYYSDVDRAIMALAIVSEDGLELGSLTYSGVDLDQVADEIEKACKRFGVMMPEGLEDKLSDMQWNRDVDAEIGPGWASSQIDKYR